MNYCQYCQQEINFEKQKKNWKSKVFCTRSCAVKNSLKNRKNVNDPWTEAEIDLLGKWIGAKPIVLIAKEWNQIAKKRGWTERTINGIRVKAKRLASSQKTSLRSYKDNWDGGKLANILGIPTERVRGWRRRGLLDYTKLTHNQTIISKKQFKKFAQEFPEELGGINPKNLRKILKDSKLVRAISVVNAPRMGRKMTIVRLDTGDIYPSARQASCVLAPEMNCSEKTAKSNILRVVKKGTPMKNGMDFYQLDYPVFWCPDEMRKEFNFLAGKVLYELYLNICTVVGYQKQSCLIVASRLAVVITQQAFQLNSYDIEKKNNPVRAKSTIIEFYSQKYLEKLFYAFNHRNIFVKIQDILYRRIIKNCYAITNSDRIMADEYAKDFVNFYIIKETERFYKKSFVPIGYSPKDKLERADLWSYIYNSINIWIWIGKEENGTRKKVSWIWLAFLHFCRSNKIGESIKTTAFKEGWINHERPNQEKYSLDDLLLKAEKIYDAETYDLLSMFVALKLEDASDLEIAEVLKVPVSQLPKFINQLQKCS